MLLIEAAFNEQKNDIDNDNDNITTTTIINKQTTVSKIVKEFSRFFIASNQSFKATIYLAEKQQKFADSLNYANKIDNSIK